MKIKKLLNLNNFIIGFTIISALIITVRQLSPSIGENIIILGMTVAAFIIGMYFGYNSNSEQATDLQVVKQKNFLTIAALFGIGVSSTFIDFLDLTLKTINTNFNPLVMLLIFLLIIILPIAYFFGKSKNFINTGSMIGVICGSIITPIILMKHLGMQITVFTVFLMFIYISLKDIYKQPKIYLIKSINLYYFLIIPIIFYINILIDYKSFAVANAYNNYEIIENNNQKILSINKSASSMIQKTTMQGFRYIELIKQILFQDLKLSGKNILVLGAGGFSFTAEGDFKNKFTYVDLDPDLQNIINKYFNKHTYGDFVGSDAAIFIKNAKYRKEKYSVVISDVYSSKNIIPSHILNFEYFINIRNILETNGLAIFNVIANPSLTDNYSWDVDNKIRKVFPSCMSIPLNYFPDKVTNIIYVCNLEH